MKVRMSDKVRTRTGEVTTLADLADRGEILFTETDRLHGRTRTAYFAEHVGPGAEDGDCWEIGAAAYASRTGQTWTP